MYIYGNISSKGIFYLYTDTHTIIHKKHKPKIGRSYSVSYVFFLFFIMRLSDPMCVYSLPARDDEHEWRRADCPHSPSDLSNSSLGSNPVTVFWLSDGTERAVWPWGNSRPDCFSGPTTKTGEKLFVVTEVLIFLHQMGLTCHPVWTHPGESDWAQIRVWVRFWVQVHLILVHPVLIHLMKETWKWRSCRSPLMVTKPLR